MKAQEHLTPVKFVTIGCPHQPVVTRWGSWLDAALCYAKNLSEVTSIVRSFEGSGIIVTQAKVSFQTAGLATQLLKIEEQYERLAKFIETMESAKCTIKEAVQAIQELHFREDTCRINLCNHKRIQTMIS